MKTALDKLASKLEGESNVTKIPLTKSFREFLLTQARVRMQDGRYGSYTFDGREALEGIVSVIDQVLGSETGTPLKDAQVDVCGGAQFGKTILALNLGVYVTGVLKRNWAYYLPDDDLVEGIVDTKLRPDVIDQIDWLAKSIQVGKALNKSGKAVNRKGAFTVSDGERIGQGMIRGMGKIPTTFSADVVMEDEKDDIDPKRAKYLKGRMTASNLRFKISIGTQRYHGLGQNKQFEDGSQGVMVIGPVGGTSPRPSPQGGEGEEASGSGWINPEENWPQICRVAMDGTPKPSDPKLTWEGDFKYEGSTDQAAVYSPEGVYYLADPRDGTPLDRHNVRWEHQRPERIALRKFSFRVSQLGIAAIDLGQIVSAWGDAVRDPEDMIVFCCDRLAMPKSSAQALTPSIVDRARNGTSASPFEKFDLSLSLKEGCVGFGGLDMGDKCWFFAREVESPLIKRARRVDAIASGDVVNRTVQLFNTMGLAALFVDAHPLLNEARTLCFVLNGVQEISWPKVPEPEKAYISLPGGLTWDGPNHTWRNVRCAVVQFTLKPGQGIRQTIGQCDEDGQTKFYPIIQTNRFDSIDRVVKEFLTNEEQVIHVIDGKLRTEPIMRLPQRVTGSPPIVETLDNHLITGSKREKGKDELLGDYIDKVENHLLLADCYSALAEVICATGRGMAQGIRSVDGIRMGGQQTRMGTFRPARL